MSLQREFIKSLAAAGFVSFHCCLSSEHPLAPSSTTVVTICLIQLLSLLSAISGFPLTKNAATTPQKGQLQMRAAQAKAVEAIDSVTVAIKNASKAFAQNLMLQIAGSLLVIVMVVRLLRAFGYFSEAWQVVLVALPLGALARCMSGGRKSTEELDSVCCCPKCGDVDCDGSPDQCPNNEDFWSVSPKTAAPKDEVDMASLLGDWTDKDYEWN